MKTIAKSRNWLLEQDEDRIVWLKLDYADSDTNVLSSEVMDELASHVETLEQSDCMGLVLFSGKQNGFIAGADVKEFRELGSESETLQYVRKCQLLLDRIERLPFPSVAIINGFCMGGGLELAMACTYRLVEDKPSIRLALPEVMLGIHPGFGGTVRLPRLVGSVTALDMILSGRGISARQACKNGLVNDIAPRRHLHTAARYLLMRRPRGKAGSFLERLFAIRPVRTLLARFLRRKLNKRVDLKHYPAPYYALTLWEKYYDDPEKMLEEEAQSITALLHTDTAQNLIRTFMLQTRMKAQGKTVPFKASHVHVIGAGTMGGDIAAWCALKGLKVTLQDQSSGRLSPAIQRAHALFVKRLKEPRLIQAAMDRLIPDTEGFGVSRADVIIEAVFEDLKTKQDLFLALEPQLKQDALLCTNTSSIPLDELGQVLNHSSRLIGLHFFNPVDKMQLIEVVSTEKTDRDYVDRGCAFAVQIGRLPLKVSSTPGFLINRILMPYLLEAAFMVQEGISPTRIDKVARDFGMPMGPVELADKVGLDVCLSVAEILTSHLGGAIPDILRDLVVAGNLGVKSGEGFYQYRHGKAVIQRADKKQADMEDIRNRLVLRLLNEAIACLREGVVEDENMLDAGMIYGTGFAPFTGGPMHYLHTLNLKKQKELFVELGSKYGKRFSMDMGWKGLS